MANQDKGPGFASGFILGALIGTIIGLLLAPQPGEKIRKLLSEEEAGLKEKAREALNEAIKVGKEAAAKAGEELRERVERAKG